jgi:hypothetical protein
VGAIPIAELLQMSLQPGHPAFAATAARGSKGPQTDAVGLQQLISLEQQSPIATGAVHQCIEQRGRDHSTTVKQAVKSPYFVVCTPVRARNLKPFVRVSTTCLLCGDRGLGNLSVGSLCASRRVGSPKEA